MNSLLISVVLLSVAACALCQYNNPCVLKPTTPNCTDYKLPDTVVQSDINNLCTKMDNMPGCSVRKICAEASYKTDMYCKDFNVYKVLCEDMPGMGGCKDYTSMCGNGSVVAECNAMALSLPSSMQTSQYIVKMCTEMPMDQCKKCPGSNTGTTNMLDCDLLTVYSDLCLSMPGMGECAAWKTFCKQIPNWPLCSHINPDTPPEMRMYFHTGYKDYVLFQGWVPRTTGQYVGTWFAVFFFGILFEVFKLMRSYLEKKWRREFYKNDERLINEHGHHNKHSTFSVPFVWSIDFTRACLQFIEVGWGFLIMLVAMTYNLGLFLAVCSGAFMGSLLFGRFMHYEPRSSCH